jgi:3-hydroxybutyryl-CoA dehydrogenase
VAEIKTIAVIGAGIMGRGIAHVAALGGYRTVLEDLIPGALRKAESDIRTNLDTAVDLYKVSSAEADAYFMRLLYVGSVD